MDYELLGSPDTGLSLVEQLGLGGKAILVTSRFEEKTIMDDCRRLGVRMIPKGMAGFVPVRAREESSRCDAVLIDDDALVHAVWKAAARTHGKVLRVFSSPAEFDGLAKTLDRATPIYLDSHLADGVRGERFAKDLAALGFEKLILCTGREACSLSDLPWITAVMGKEAPWQA